MAGFQLGINTVLLVERLVDRLVTRHTSDESQAQVRSKLATRLAMRIIGSRIGAAGPDPDEASVADQARRDLAASSSRPDLPAAFSELHEALATRLTDGGVRWALLQTLLLVSRDWRREKGNAPNPYQAAAGPHLSLAAPQPSLRAAGAALDPFRLGGAGSGQLIQGGQQLAPLPGEAARGGGGGAAGALVRSEQGRGPDLTEYEVPEALLVRDVVFACQGIDGRYVKFSDRPDIDGYIVDPSVGVPRAVRDLIRRLCEVGWLYRRVHRVVTRATAAAESGAGGAGSVYLALCGAVQAELSDYFRLVAVLEGQVAAAAQGAGAGAAALTLRRLAVWLAEPTHRMKILAEVMDSAAGKKGGALLRHVSLQMQSGDPAAQSVIASLCDAMSDPILEVLRAWLTRGELQDPHGEFFVVRGAGAASSDAAELWRTGYGLQSDMLPPFVSQRVAADVLRCGRTILFLRAVCGEEAGLGLEADPGAAAEAQALARLKPPRVAAGLESVVSALSARLDARLCSALLRRFQLAEHLGGVRKYLLLCQGDFARALIEEAGPDLSNMASSLTEYSLTAALNAALRLSSAQYDPPEVTGSLRARLERGGTGAETGWDVFLLGYEVPPPLTPLFTPEAMLHYSQVFRLVWRLKRVEHALAGGWSGLKPNGRALHLRRGRDLDDLGAVVQAQLLRTVRACHVIRAEMQHLVAVLQGYISVEVLDGAWDTLQLDLGRANNLDQMSDAHDRYIEALRRRTLVHDVSQKTMAKLQAVLGDVLEFCGAAARADEYVAEQVLRLGARRAALAAESQASGSWSSQHELSAREAEAMVSDLRAQEGRMHDLRRRYQEDLDVFGALLSSQTHLDLRSLQQRLGLEAEDEGGM